MPSSSALSCLHGHALHFCFADEHVRAVRALFAVQRLPHSASDRYRLVRTLPGRRRIMRQRCLGIRFSGVIVRGGTAMRDARKSQLRVQQSKRSTDAQSMIWIPRAGTVTCALLARHALDIWQLMTHVSNTSTRPAPDRLLRPSRLQEGPSSRRPPLYTQTFSLLDQSQAVLLDQAICDQFLDRDFERKLVARTCHRVRSLRNDYNNCSA